ncbi:hypothetical protein FOA52_008746 [Chlamydomonas sp. UWO 241]|nr:hypothetical protein FOA52_008746 [Chlamydomonas sp. UWO 241]
MSSSRGDAASGGATDSPARTPKQPPPQPQPQPQPQPRGSGGERAQSHGEPGSGGGTRGTAAAAAASPSKAQQPQRQQQQQPLEQQPQQKPQHREARGDRGGAGEGVGGGSSSSSRGAQQQPQQSQQQQPQQAQRQPQQPQQAQQQRQQPSGANNGGAAGAHASGGSVAHELSALQQRRSNSKSPGRGRLAAQAATEKVAGRRQPGALTPGAAKEAKIQALLADHKERTRSLTKERQGILQNQAMWTGDTAQPARLGTPEHRNAARAALVRQLQEEQASAEALVEELRNDKPYREAQAAAQRVAQSMEEVRAGARAHPGTIPSMGTAAAAAGNGRGHNTTFELGTTGASARSDTTGARANGSSAAHLPQHPASERSSVVPPPSLGGSARLGASGRQAEAARPSTPTSLVFHEPESRRWNLDAPLPRSAQAQRPPEYVEEMRSQVAALQEMVQTQMEWQQHAAAMQMQTLQQAVGQQQQQQQQQQQPPVIIMPQMPGYPPQAQQISPQHSRPAFGAGGTARGGLASDLEGDPVVRNAHAVYKREMALVKMQIERAKGEAELGRLKHLLLEMKRDTADLAIAQGELPPGANPPNDVLMMDVEGGDGGDSFFSDPDGQPVQEAYANGENGDDDDDDEGTTEWGDGERLEDTPYGEGAGGGSRHMFADVLQVYVQLAGPFQRRGTYRVRVVLYDGFQPLLAGPGLLVGASTKRIGVTEHAAAGGLSSVWNDTITLRGLRITPTMMLVFELYNAKPAIAGLPAPESIVAWGYSSLLAKGELIQGSQSVALHRLPLMIAAQRKFSFGGAMIEFSVTRSDGQPGDITNYGDDRGSTASSLLGAQGARAPQTEDVPGVPVEAWCLVARGIPPLDPFTPGEGCVLMVDGARFLPANVTISKVVASVWSSDKRQLTPGYYESVASPESNAYCPKYSLQTTLGQGAERFDQSTATVLFVVHTVCRWTRQQRVVGYAALPLFSDPRTGEQPASKNVRDYVLNQGSFQIPLHIAPPAPSAAFRGDSLEGVPRLPCASLLVRVFNPEAAKAARRKETPLYADRVYDTTRAKPTPVERKLYPKYLARKVQSVREAARALVAGATQLPGYKAQMGVLRPSPPPGGYVAPQAASAAAPEKGGGLFGKLKTFTRGAGDAAPKPDGSFGTGPDPGQAYEEAEQTGLPGQLPQTDADLMDWIEDRLRGNNQRPLNYNLSSEYFPDLGFYVACDGAMRLDRQLPAATLITFAPPGSFYLDNPVVDDMKATLDYDMNSCLAGPRWTDGFQHMENIIYEPGLAVIFDVRLLIPTTGNSSPAGWAALPVFEKSGQFVATGSYHLPLFQGVPSRFIIQEMASKGDVDSVIQAHAKSGRLRVSEDCPSVTVRLMDFSRQGQLPVPAGQGQVGTRDLKLPGYISELGAKFLVTMRKEIKNRTYSKAKPANTTEAAWVQELNDCILKVAGMDTGAADARDEDASSSSDDDDATEAGDPVRRRTAESGGSKPSSALPAGTGGKSSGPGHSTIVASPSHLQQKVQQPGTSSSLQPPGTSVSQQQQQQQAAMVQQQASMMAQQAMMQQQAMVQQQAMMQQQAAMMAQSQASMMGPSGYPVQAPTLQQQQQQPMMPPPGYPMPPPGYPMQPPGYPQMM